MRARSASLLGVSLIIVVLAAASLAQSPQVLPGCEPAPEVSKALDEMLNDKQLQTMRFGDQVARQHALYEELIAKYPREVEPYRRLIEQASWLDGFLEPSPYPAVTERFPNEADQHPDDPLALYLAGIALFDFDTPQSLRLLEAAKTKAPQFPWPLLALAEEYSSGKRMDKQKSSDNLAAFFARCPDSRDGGAQRLLSRDDVLQPKVAIALRASLAKETDPGRLGDYEMLWGLEFRSHPPQEHAALRKQVVEDLKRVEALNPKPDSEWLAFLIRGYQQAGASSETITPMEDRLLRDYPSTDDAYDIVRDRWNDSHKKPEDQKDTAAWANYHRAHKEAVHLWMREFPNDTHLAHGAWLWSSEDDSLTENEAVAAMDEFLRHTTVFGSPGAWIKVGAARLLLKHKWQPSRALDLLENAKTIEDRMHGLYRASDNLSADAQADRDEEQLGWDLHLDGLILEAAQLARRADARLAIKQIVEGPAPKSEKLQSEYWWNRARLALIENRKQDALAYYQLSLQTRLQPPQYSEGGFEDDLSDEAQSLWKQMGGTPAAWAVWSQPPASKAAVLAEGIWEKPKKTLPAFALSDLSGKNWSLKELGGKTVLITLWATWCGECKAELPKLQKLYEQLRGRSDLQILTFDVDEDLGQVAPYLKDKGYTFPVVPAYSLVVNLLDGYTIPQNWIVDAKGNWMWTQIGYDPEDDWAQMLKQKLDSAKTSD